jgi:hypothetical protein
MPAFMPSPASHPTGFIEPCLPTPSRTVPVGAGWAFELKHDGYRFVARRDGDRVRVFPSLIAYVNRYRSAPVPADFKVRFLDYDWTVNHRKWSFAR